MNRGKKYSKKNRILSIVALFLTLTVTACGQVTDTKTEQPSHNSQNETVPATESKQDSSAGNLEVHYIDVEQGDATLITCDGQSMLIDAGNNDKGTAIQLYLSKLGITTLDYVIGTHPDADHIGGMDVVITKFDCGNIFLTEEEKDTATYRDVLSAIEYKGYKKTMPEVGESYTLGSANFVIAAPKSLTSDSNDNSIAIVLTHGNNKFYFEGDAGEKEEEEILNTGIDVSANVYKIGHHGSKTSTGDEMLKAVNPTYAVISVGDNSYGHPNAEVLTKLREKGIEVFRTDEQGSIIAVSNGESVTWNTSSSTSWQAGEPQAASETEQNTESVNEEVLTTKTYGVPNQNNEQEQPETAEIIEGADSDTTEVMVHITETGTKYHSPGCQYLKESDITVNLSDAKARGLSPCSKCNPPQ